MNKNIVACVSLLALSFASISVGVAQDRMPPIAPEKLTAEQKKAIEEFKAARGAEISGPFVPLLRSPEVMTRARAMGDYLRFKSALPPRLSEFVILLTARKWTQNYEWNAHAPLAIKGGLKQDIVDAIADGRHRWRKMSKRFTISSMSCSAIKVSAMRRTQMRSRPSANRA